MLPNIKACENGRSTFSENLRVVAIKLLELSQHRKYQFHLILLGVGVRSQCQCLTFIAIAVPYVPVLITRGALVVYRYTSAPI